jgi:hypothetical protein
MVKGEALMELQPVGRAGHSFHESLNFLSSGA